MLPQNMSVEASSPQSSFFVLSAAFNSVNICNRIRGGGMLLTLYQAGAHGCPDCHEWDIALEMRTVQASLGRRRVLSLFSLIVNDMGNETAVGRLGGLDSKGEGCCSPSRVALGGFP